MKLQSYSDWRERRADEAIRVLRMSGHRFGMLLLDLGCGQGHLDKKFLEIGICVVGIDTSITYLQTAKKNAPGCNFIVCDGAHLPFKNFVFSTVICNDVLEHVSYSTAYSLIKEANRVLDASGKIYLSVMNRWEITEPHWLIPFFTWMPRFLWDRMFPVLVRLSPKANNTISNIRYSDHYFPYTNDMLKRLVRESQLEFDDYTNFYAREKIFDPDYIGSSFVRIVVKVLRSLKLTCIAVALAQKTSVLVCVCFKKSNSSV